MNGMRRPALAFVLLLLLGPAGRPAAQGPAVEDRFDTTTCDVLEASGESCGQVRFGWADCPGQRRVPCDVCYSPSGRPIAYVKRTNPTYRLSSGCEHLEDMPAEDVFLIASDPDAAERWEEKGFECGEQRGELICQKPSGDKKASKPPETPPPSPTQAAAQKIKAQWDAEKKKAPGRSFSHAAVPFGPQGKRTVKDKKTGKVKTVTIPPGILHAVEVRGPFEVAYDPKGKTVARFVDQSGAAGGMTGTFFNPRTLEPGGPVLSGKGNQRQVVARRTLKGVPDPKTGKKDHVAVPRTFLGSGQGGLFVRDLPTDLAALQKEINLLKKDGTLQGLGGMGRLLRGGKNAVQEARQVQGLDDGQAGDRRDARTAAGIDEKGTRLILLVQEGDDTHGTGAGITQLGEILKELGAKEAVILDGGGSTQIYIPSLHVRYDGRVQPTAILFR